jgi:hypothetical protein
MLERRRRGGIFGRDLDLAAMERFLDAIVIEGEAGTRNNAVPRGGQAARSSRVARPAGGIDDFFGA